ncbi:MAG: GNAT family N-acetyltransferase [Parvularculaceae bacterium]
MTLTIREGEPRDAGIIAELVRDLAAYEKLAHEATASAENFRTAIEHGHCRVLIAEWNGRPCGFALYFFNFSTFLGRRGVYLEDLFVREEHRSKGVGRALLARLARIAKENECGRLEWWVLDWNVRAIAFYRALGAAPMDEWTVFRLADDALERLAGSEGGT